MRRRIVEIFVATAILLVPALSVALPRPPDARQTEPEQQVCFSPNNCNISVASGSSGTTRTPRLFKDRTYRLEITGTWLFAGSQNPNLKADAVCETSNGTFWTKSTVRGIEIQNTFYGGSQNCNPNNNKYSFEIKASGDPNGEPLRIIDTNYGDNVGSLTVKVWAYYQVTYQLPIANQELPGQNVEQEVIPTTTVTPGTIPPVGIPPITIPGATLPQIGSITFNHEGQRWCITLNTNAQGSIPGQRIEVGCVFDAGKQLGLPLPDATIPIGGNTVPGQTLCQSSCEIVPGVPLQPITIPGVTVSAGIPPGSKLELTLKWTADTTKLWRAFSDQNPNTGQQTVALYAPFDTTQRDWFIEQVQSGRQGLTIMGQIKDPDGKNVGNIPAITFPGLGQVLEAMFWSQLPVVN